MTVDEDRVERVRRRLLGPRLPGLLTVEWIANEGDWVVIEVLVRGEVINSMTVANYFPGTPQRTVLAAPLGEVVTCRIRACWRDGQTAEWRPPASTQWED